jgi:hypothetical protein
MAVLLPVGFLLLVVAASYHEAARAGDFLRELAALSPGETEFSEAVELLSRYSEHGQLESSPPAPARTLSFQFDNRFLARLRLAPPTQLIVNIIGSEKVASVMVAFGVSPRNAASYGIHLAGSVGHPGPEVEMKRFGTGKPGAQFVFGPSLPADQRQRLFMLNVACLQRIGGCADWGELASNLRSLGNSEDFSRKTMMAGVPHLIQTVGAPLVPVLPEWDEAVLPISRSCQTENPNTSLLDFHKKIPAH